MAKKKPPFKVVQFNKQIDPEIIKNFRIFYNDFRGIFYDTENVAAADIIKAGMAVLRPELEKKKAGIKK
jgi:methanogenic corrinoid protein MtbC1